MNDIVNNNSLYPYIELSSFLNNSQDSVVLFDSNGTLIDKYIYSEDYGKDKSFGRSPDGADNWTLLDSSTKGLQNSNPQQLPTLTPIPTLTPTKTPTPSKTPTPVKVPTATKVPTPTKTPKPPTPTKIPIGTNLPNSQQVTSQKLLPTSKIASRASTIEVDKDVLGSDTKKQSATNSAENSQPGKGATQVMGQSINYIPVIYGVVGTIFLVISGIILIRKYIIDK